MPKATLPRAEVHLQGEGRRQLLPEVRGQQEGGGEGDAERQASAEAAEAQKAQEAQGAPAGGGGGGGVVYLRVYGPSTNVATSDWSFIVPKLLHAVQYLVGKCKKKPVGLSKKSFRVYGLRVCSVKKNSSSRVQLVSALSWCVDAGNGEQRIYIYIYMFFLSEEIDAQQWKLPTKFLHEYGYQTSSIAADLHL